MFILRVLRHLGCPYGCEEGQRGPPADFLRSQGQSLMARLQRSSQRRFGTFLRHMVRLQHLQDVMDLFHAYLGFCVDPSTLLSPLSTCHEPNQTTSRLTGFTDTISSHAQATFLQNSEFTKSRQFKVTSSEGI